MRCAHLQAERTSIALQVTGHVHPCAAKQLKQAIGASKSASTTVAELAACASKQLQLGIVM